MLQETPSETVRWSDENIIDLIRKVRNDLIKDFLDERHLCEYVAVNYRLKEVPKLKIEFIRNDLKDLLITPVDTFYYQNLIRQIGETDSAAISAGNEELFYKEIESILKRYLY
jgi:hypothetical protein